ncbi:hypothetical protein [Streptomyces sp. 2P-4]|uniref:hypothetical protein n=1 Tax=Streptomyces sp. 2P-4 TaxID=2931974 RepID=UPI00254252A1|nr:hypothetical protein [Streptomyces sp. 2P-4]
MRIRSWATAVTAAACCILPLAAPAAAEDKPARGVAWSASHETATASGGRWVERPSSGGLLQVVAEGRLANTGEGCYSVWARWQFDFVPTPPRKQATVCGNDTVDVRVRQSYMPTTTGSIAVCKGTEDTRDCGSWQSLTSWPVTRP